MSALKISLSSIFFIAFFLACLEIFLERWKSGWGGEFTNKFWGKKYSAEPFFTHVSRYHLLMFGVVLPVLYGTLCYVYRDRTVWYIFFPALWLGVGVLEDFLYFALIGAVADNWLRGKGFVDAFRRMIHGGMPWHTYWKVPMTNVRLPWFYFVSPGVVVVLLVVQEKIMR